MNRFENTNFSKVLGISSNNLNGFNMSGSQNYNLIYNQATSPSSFSTFTYNGCACIETT